MAKAILMKGGSGGVTSSDVTASKAQVLQGYRTITSDSDDEVVEGTILDREIGNIVDIKNNDKAKSSRGYERWVTKHNLQTAASTLVEIRDKGFNSIEELERGISQISIEKK